MAFTKTYIPYGMYWSTPFCKWQGSFAHLHPIPFAADVCKAAMAKRNLDPKIFDSLVLGITIPQKNIFYGGPWIAALIGAPDITGPMIGQACATSAKAIPRPRGRRLGIRLRQEFRLRRGVLRAPL